jgi:hypothetical protein
MSYPLSYAVAVRQYPRHRSLPTSRSFDSPLGGPAGKFLISLQPTSGSAKAGRGVFEPAVVAAARLPALLRSPLPRPPRGHRGRRRCRRAAAGAATPPAKANRAPANPLLWAQTAKAVGLSPHPPIPC